MRGKRAKAIRKVAAQQGMSPRELGKQYWFIRRLKGQHASKTTTPPIPSEGIPKGFMGFRVSRNAGPLSRIFNAPKAVRPNHGWYPSGSNLKSIRHMLEVLPERLVKKYLGRFGIFSKSHINQVRFL